MLHPSPHNLCELFHRQVQRLGPRPALRHKRHGLYSDLSWEAYERLVDALAAGWVQLGVRPGDRVAILAENRFEWLVTDLGILAAGAADVPLHAPLTAGQVAYQLADSAARWVVVSSAEQLAKVLEVSERLPALEGLVVLDAAAFRRGPAPSGKEFRLLSWAGLVMRGRRATAVVQGEQRMRQERIGAEDLATIIYTSGTTGEPKGVMLTHGNLLSNAQATYESLPPRDGDVLLSWLPYSHIYARLVDHYFSILAGTTIALAEGFESILRNIAEIQPTHMTGVPRFYEKVWEQVAKQPEADRPARMRHLLGPRMRWMSAGGAPLPVPVAEGFERCGIPLLEGYGLTESSPVIAFNTLENHRIGTVGRPIPGVEVRIAPDGEILTRGPHVMRGYWAKPEATREVLSADGWLHTGDIGELDPDGFLRITGRKKDLIVTAAGKNVSPQQIEALLMADELIDQAVVYGDRRPFLSALVVPNFSALAAHLAARGIPPAGPREMVGNPEVRRLYEGRIERRMAEVSSPERVKRFVLLDHPFTLEGEELTATLKVRRQAVIAHHQRQLDELYEPGFGGTPTVNPHPS